MPVVFPDTDSTELKKCFTPDYTPAEVFRQGVFMDHIDNGIGGYWRPIYSTVLGKEIKNQHLKYDWGDLYVTKLVRSDPKLAHNKHSVKAGQSLRVWESKGWIDPRDPYGWLQWYCEYFGGRRIPNYDNYQIKRWISIKKRFGRLRNKTPAIKQTLLNWAIKSD